MLKRQTVLVVDDEPRLADSLAAVLRGSGLEVRTAHNGIQGCSSYFRDPTDWIVTDIEMAELNGIDMVQCIRAINASVKTIYMTGAADKHWALLTQEAHGFGAQILRKPFAFNQVIEMLADKQRTLAKTATANITKKSVSKTL
jgi:two-component system response regulator GlrR